MIILKDVFVKRIPMLNCVHVFDHSLFIELIPLNYDYIAGGCM